MVKTQRVSHREAPTAFWVNDRGATRLAAAESSAGTEVSLSFNKFKNADLKSATVSNLLDTSRSIVR